jgi:hypothetical protein
MLTGCRDDFVTIGKKEQCIEWSQKLFETLEEIRRKRI